MKKQKERINDLVQALEDLVRDAERVSNKFGHDDNNVPSDWSEWKYLRNCLMKAKHILAREK
jgi:hypothetical protein